MGQVVLAAQDLPRCLQPVLGEGALQPTDYRSPDANVGVPPMVRVLRVPGPLLGDPHSTRHPHLAVRDQDPAVRAVGEAAKRVGPDRPEAPHLDPGVLHLTNLFPVHHGRTERVEQDVAADAGTGALADRVGDLVGDVPLPVHVRLQVQRPLRAADRLEDCGEDRVAVDEQLDLAPLGDRCSRERLRDPQEVGRVDLDLSAQVVAERALAAMAKAVGHVPARDRGTDARGPQPAGWLSHPTITETARGSTSKPQPPERTSSPSTLNVCSPSNSIAAEPQRRLCTPGCPSTSPARSP